jgi:hypothetical protein
MNNYVNFDDKKYKENDGTIYRYDNDEWVEVGKVDPNLKPVTLKNELMLIAEMPDGKEYVYMGGDRWEERSTKDELHSKD